MRNLSALILTLVFATTASAAFMFEIDTDGADDGVLTYNPNFSFGGDTTSASQSGASGAPFVTGGDSIFGGNGAALPDTYVYTYAPDVEGDNLPLNPGDALGEGSYATGLECGGPGLYSVYVTYPYTDNVSGGPTTYDIVTNGDAVNVVFDQNGHGNAWIPIGLINYTDGPITVTQMAGDNTYVSMRAYGLLFEPVPEPATLSLLALGGLALLRRR